MSNELKITDIVPGMVFDLSITGFRVTVIMLSTKTELTDDDIWVEYEDKTVGKARIDELCPIPTATELLERLEFVEAKSPLWSREIANDSVIYIDYYDNEWKIGTYNTPIACDHIHQAQRFLFGCGVDHRLREAKEETK